MTSDFNADGSDLHLRSAAIAEAISWFLRRGYIPSIPVEPTQYDLIVESDTGFKRVQVKSTTVTERGRWLVGCSRQVYESGGNRKRTAYTANEIDFLFIVTSNNDKYLIPIAVTNGNKTLTLDDKYAKYKISDYYSTGRERLPVL
jgi:hypothetical protein